MLMSFFHRSSGFDFFLVIYSATDPFIQVKTDLLPTRETSTVLDIFTRNMHCSGCGGLQITHQLCLVIIAVSQSLCEGLSVCEISLEK